MDATLQKIIVTSHLLFSKYGIRSVSMNDIANELGMSKKTLYTYVDNKADLVKLGLQAHLQEECAVAQKIQQEASNAIDETIQIGNYIYRQLNMLNPAALYDLRKYYRDSWELIEQHRTEFIYSIIAANLKNGIEQGLYRANIKPELIARFYVAKASMFFIDTHNISKSVTNYKLGAIYLELLKYHLYGIVSDKGMDYLKNKLNNIKNNTYVTDL
jgi:AcrR family transcriptional regulator